MSETTAEIEVYGAERPFGVIQGFTNETGSFSLRVNRNVWPDGDHEIALSVSEDQLDKIVIVTPDGNTHRVAITRVDIDGMSI